MNITSYVNDDSKVRLFHGKLSMKFDYSIVNADENIYRYLGVNSGRTFTALIHPEDLPSFYDCVEHLEEGTQHLTLRFLSDDEKYRYVYMVMTKTKKSIDAEIIDIANNHWKYDYTRNNLFKYKKLMNYSGNIYLEYYYDSRTVNIFEHANERGIIHFNKNIDLLYDEVINSNHYTNKQKQEFSVLHDSLVDGTDNIRLSVEGSIFGFPKCILNIHGGIMYMDGKKQMFVAVVKKVEYEQAKIEEKYYKSSHAIDPATGTYNKRAISELALDILASAEANRRYVIMLDIDDFKSINDTYGHMVGDEVIAKAAEVIKRYVGEKGYVGRFGGDEFFIITDKIADEEGLIYMLKTIRKNLAWDCEDIIPDFDVTTSIGISCYPENAKTYDELFLIADKCLYLAKSKGKNRYIIYRPDFHGDIEKIKSHKMLPSDSACEDNYQQCGTALYLMADIRDKNVPIEDCLERIRQKFSIDGISIYTGSNCGRYITSGQYQTPIANAAFLNDPSGNSLFDENGVLCINKIINMKEKWNDAYEMLGKQGNVGVFIVKEPGAAVSYDPFSRLRKWSELEKGLLLMIGKALIERVKQD